MKGNRGTGIESTFAFEERVLPGPCLLLHESGSGLLQALNSPFTLGSAYSRPTWCSLSLWAGHRDEQVGEVGARGWHLSSGNFVIGRVLQERSWLQGVVPPVLVFFEQVHIFNTQYFEHIQSQEERVTGVFKPSGF